MNSILETQRLLHEEKDLLEEALVKALTEDNSKKTKKEQTYQEIMCSFLVVDIQKKAEALLRLYEDKDSSRERELQAISKPNEFTEFYKRFSEIKNYYKSERNVIEPPVSVGYGDNHPFVLQKLSMFTDEEGYGRYLDLHEFHNTYLNFIKKNQLEKKTFNTLNYLEYINSFDDFKSIPVEKKRTHMFLNYVKSLRNYFYEYYQRSHPMQLFEPLVEEIENTFELQWSHNKIVGWEQKEMPDLPIKLYCIPCCKQFAKELTFQSHLSGKKHKKAQERLNASGSSVGEVGTERRLKELNLRERDKSISKLEFEIQFLASKMNEQREGTKMNVERKQARTSSEWGEESEESDVSEDNNEIYDDNQAAIYNPKNLPLDWDGKRIPYWLYKLHGLSKYYRCDICDGTEYRGPKAFSKHFQEARHSQGMKLLGIPNTIHFQNVINKEDALKRFVLNIFSLTQFSTVWDKIRENKQQLIFRPDYEEEFEDSRGNVMPKRIFDDLKNNNLL